MNRFNEYMGAHFQQGGCRLIARARDECRQRDVRIYAMPGYWDVVGVSDGTDAWIAPASAGLFFQTATGDCADIMRRLKAGEPIPRVCDHPRRTRVHLDEPTPPRSRERVRI